MTPRLKHLGLYILLAAGSVNFVISDCKFGPMDAYTVTPSSEENLHKATDAFTEKGWCASQDVNGQWLEIDFTHGFGAKKFTIGSTTVDNTSYPSSVLVQYVPNIGTDLTDFPVGNNQALIIHLNNTGTSSVELSIGFAVKKLRFILNEFKGRACMTLNVSGCTLNKLCSNPCQNGGHCVSEDNCQCQGGFQGKACEMKPCTPEVLGLHDGRIPQNNVLVSSEDPSFPKGQMGFDTSNTSFNTGWCAEDNDAAPWVQIHFDETKSISTFIFYYINGKDTLKTYMRQFELQYIAPTDSARVYRTYATNVDSLNGTHAIQIDLLPPVITDTIRLVSTSVEGKACFKLELKGCDPRGLCQAGWCKNGGSCVGKDICKCQTGFLGDRCDKTKDDINTLRIAFLNITNNRLITTSFTFSITGSVRIQQENKENIIVINGPDSNVKLAQGTVGAECFHDIDTCKTGFTLALEVKFGSLPDNTYVVSSGGNLPNHRGLALYYNQRQLTYVVTTSTQTWILTVPYVPVVNIWQKFEITWSTSLGIGLFLNEKLLGTHSKPQPTSATLTGDLCIGCNPGQVSQVVIDMQIKEIHTWTVSRTELVNVGIVRAPVVTTRLPVQTSTKSVPSTPPTTQHVTTRVPVMTKLTTKVTTTRPPVTSVTTKLTTPSHGYQVYNMTFTKIVGTLLITPTFNFTIHGNPKLELQNNSQTALVLDCSKSQYVELLDHGIPCLQDLDNCQKGFTFRLEALITKTDQQEKTYILSSGGDQTAYNGMALYLHSNLLIYGVKKGNKHWASSTNIQNVIRRNTWYLFEISWIEQTGLSVLIDGYEVIREKDWTPSPGRSHSNPVLIGKSTDNNYTSCMKVRNLYTWTIQREVLVTSGVLPAAKMTPKPKPTTVAATSPSTSSATTSTPTPKTKTKSTTPTIPTTTEPPIPTFHWNLSSIPSTNVIVGLKYNLTVHGTPITLNGGLDLKNSTQYIDLGGIKCLLNPITCLQGLTIQFAVNIKFIQENTFLLTSGGQLPNGVGIAVLYRYGQYQFVVSTATQSWYAVCGKDILTLDKVHTIMLSWHATTGLEIIIDNKQVQMVTIPITHEVSTVSTTTVYVGKQPSATIKYEYIVQTVTIWYAHVDILVVGGLCPKPDRPGKQTTAAINVSVSTKTVSASPFTKFTGIVTTKAPQCPAGCVSIAKTTSKPDVTATSKHPDSGSDKSTPVSATSRPPPVKTETPTTVKTTAPPTPTTTERAAPNYHTEVTITATYSTTDKEAYLVCAFTRPSEAGIENTVALLIENKRVLVQTVAGETGVATFAVSQVNRDLYRKKIQCSLVANYVGSSHSTQVFVSNTYIPDFTVKPAAVTVTEGRPGKYVTVHSMAPPQLYCCTGCKGQCQVHVVGTFVLNRKDTRCYNNFISQAVIESAKPPNYNREICGFALTNTNWNNENTIFVTATLDNRRDGTQKRELKIVVNVYNQPPTAQITDKPVVHVLSPHVQVTILDNYHSPYTCKSVNDPHMLTFDGAHFNNMNEGQFVMFRHTELPFEVRSWYYKCSSRSHATCNCGVAIKSGDDVISVIGCHTVTSHGHPGHGHGIGLILQQLFSSHGNAHGHDKDQFAKAPMMIQIYKNGELTPGTFIRRYGCGQKYEIQLPTGMIITVQQSYKPFINIWIKASSSDRGKSTGLCGNFNGVKDEWKNGNRGTAAFIQEHKAPTDNFFNGVGVSTLVTGSTYCSCVEGKGSVCSPGLGHMQCTRSKYDITAALLRQAKAPILTSSRQKRQVTTTDVAPTIIPDGSNMTKDEAADECREAILNNTVTNYCQPILTTNLTQQIENCAEDYLATGSFVWAKSALSDIAVDCVESANAILANNDTEGDTNTTGVDLFVPDNLDEILSKACVDDCGINGECQGGVCMCKDGYTGVTCEISRNTKPIVSSVPYLCDVSATVDCMGAVVYGDNFVNSSTLTCHFEYIEVSDTVQVTQQTQTVTAQFMSLNQVMCLLPRLQSARIKISNNGQTLSDRASPHVVFDSGCYTCLIQNNTNGYMPVCIRLENNCVIDGECYQPGQNKPGDSCRNCNPAINDTEWSTNQEKAECRAQPVTMAASKTEDNEKKVIALAVVSAVLAAILLVLIVHIVKSRSKSKAQSGEYQVQSGNKLHQEDAFHANPIYNQGSEKL